MQIGQTRIATVADIERAVKDAQRTWAIAFKCGSRLFQLQVQV